MTDQRATQNLVPMEQNGYIPDPTGTEVVETREVAGARNLLIQLVALELGTWDGGFPQWVVNNDLRTCRCGEEIEEGELMATFAERRLRPLCERCAGPAIDEWMDGVRGMVKEEA